MVDYNTNCNWVVNNPEGKTITFKHGKGLYVRIPYTDMDETQKGFVMFQTFRKNFEGYTKHQVEKASYLAICRQRPDIQLIQSSNSW